MTLVLMHQTLKTTRRLAEHSEDQQALASVHRLETQAAEALTVDEQVQVVKDTVALAHLLLQRDL